MSTITSVDVENQAQDRPVSPRNVEQAPDSVNLLESLISLAERKNWILTVTASITVLVGAGSLLLPNHYVATTKILPPQPNQSLAASFSGQLASMGPLAAMAGGNLGIKNPSDLYVGMLKSRTVKDAIIGQFDLRTVYRTSKMSDARDRLEQSSNIAAGKEGFISISVDDKDRKRAAEMANAYVRELQKLTQTVAVTEAGRRRIFFEQQVGQAKQNLTAAEQALKETQQKTGVIQLEGQAKAIFEAVGQVKAQIAAKEVQLQAMRSFGTEQNPDIMLTNQELTGLRAQLNKLEQQQNAGAGDVQVPTGKMPEAGLEYLRRLREVKYNESIFEGLAKQYEIAKLDEMRQGTAIQVIDPATEPDKKSSPKRTLIVVIAWILSFLSACAWVLAANSMRELQQQYPEQQARFERLLELLTNKKVKIAHS